MSQHSLAVCLNNIHFRYSKGVEDFQLRLDHLSVARGESVALVGPSGSGKSTLLGLICGVLRPESGSVEVLDQRIDVMSDRERDRFRANHLGIIFQQFNLLSYLPVVENVILALAFSRHRALPTQEKRHMAEQLLAALDIDLTSLGHQKAARLSVGQQQRVAAARAFVAEPEIIIADEPTSALDSDRRTEFVDLLFRQRERTGATLILVTHRRNLAKSFDRTIDLSDLLQSTNAEGQVQ